MSMNRTRAKALRMNNQAAARDANALRAQILEIENDPTISDLGKRQRTAPLRAQIAERIAAYRAANEGLVAAIQQDAAALSGEGVRRFAALKEPARVVALRQLAETLEDDELFALARIAATPEQPDHALAYALGTANGARLSRMDEATRKEFRSIVDSVGVTPESQTIADALVVARVEMARYESLGDPLTAPAAITRYREAVTVPTPTGKRMLSESEVAAAYTRVGLSLAPTQPEAREAVAA